MSQRSASRAKTMSSTHTKSTLMNEDQMNFYKIGNLNAVIQDYIKRMLVSMIQPILELFMLFITHRILEDQYFGQLLIVLILQKFLSGFVPKLFICASQVEFKKFYDNQYKKATRVYTTYLIVFGSIIAVIFDIVFTVVSKQIFAGLVPDVANNTTMFVLLFGLANFSTFLYDFEDFVLQIDFRYFSHFGMQLARSIIQLLAFYLVLFIQDALKLNTQSVQTEIIILSAIIFVSYLVPSVFMFSTQLILLARKMRLYHVCYLDFSLLIPFRWQMLWNTFKRFLTLFLPHISYYLSAIMALTQSVNIRSSSEGQYTQCIVNIVMFVYIGSILDVFCEFSATYIGNIIRYSLDRRLQSVGITMFIIVISIDVVLTIIIFLTANAMSRLILTDVLQSDNQNLKWCCLRGFCKIGLNLIEVAALMRYQSIPIWFLNFSAICSIVLVVVIPVVDKNIDIFNILVFFCVIEQITGLGGICQFLKLLRTPGNPLAQGSAQRNQMKKRTAQPLDELDSMTDPKYGALKELENVSKAAEEAYGADTGEDVNLDDIGAVDLSHLEVRLSQAQSNSEPVAVKNAAQVIVVNNEDAKEVERMLKNDDIGDVEDMDFNFADGN